MEEPPNRPLGPSASLEELETQIAELNAWLEPHLKRLTALKRSHRAKKAGKRSGESRREKISEAAVRMAREELPGIRGTVAVLAERFECSPRTISRKLKRTRPADDDF